MAEALDKAKVDYAIVGGFAVALHGAARGTFDVDIILKLTKSDFIAAEKVFSSMGLQCKLPVKADQIFDFREEYIKNKNLIAWSFYNPKDLSEVVNVIITHDLKKMKTKKITWGKVTLKVLAIESLIAMKKMSGRPQDLEDIKALEELKK